jgi:hypothetical protein
MYLPGSNQAVMGGRAVAVGFSHRDLLQAMVKKKYPAIRCWLYDVDDPESRITRAQTNAGKTDAFRARLQNFVDG